MADLRTLQRSFWSVMTDPFGAADVLARDTSHAWLESAVRADAGASARARLAVYANMYFHRLRDNLAADFPRLRTVLGADHFDRLIADYLTAHPSRHASVRNLGRALPAFMRVGAASHAWLSDLAALEWARLDVFDRADEPTLDLSQLREAAAHGLVSLRLQIIAAHLRVKVAHDVTAIWRQPDAGAAPPRGPGTLLVWRRTDDSVHHRVLEPEEPALLAALCEGLTFTDLCAHLCAGREPRAAAVRAFELVSAWTAADLLRAA